MRSRLEQLGSDLENEPEVQRLLGPQPSPRWSIYSKETTPEIVREEVQIDLTEHWKRDCESKRQDLLHIGLSTSELEAIRCTISNADYWRSEARLYQAEFWRVLQRRQTETRPRMASRELREKPKSTQDVDHISSGLCAKHSHGKSVVSKDDEPISSRLRTRTYGNNGTSKKIGNLLSRGEKKNNPKERVTNKIARQRVKSRP